MSQRVRNNCIDRGSLCRSIRIPLSNTYHVPDSRSRFILLSAPKSAAKINNLSHPSFAIRVSRPSHLRLWVTSRVRAVCRVCFRASTTPCRTSHPGQNEMVSQNADSPKRYSFSPVKSSSWSMVLLWFPFSVLLCCRSSVWKALCRGAERLPCRSS